MYRKKTIGSEEWCFFPSLSLPPIKARVDSGAKTSSIHAFATQPSEREGALWIDFSLHPLQGNQELICRCSAPLLDQRSVRSSRGVVEKRFVVKVPLVLGKQQWDIELTLSNREKMGYRMLLGREALAGRFLIDPESSFLLGGGNSCEPTSFREKKKPVSSL